MIIKKNLSEQIYSSVRRDIIDQKIKFGEKLVNKDLRDKYGVSSTPVRDAINHLYSDGLLEDISNGGAQVITFDLEMAMEINEIVCMLGKDSIILSSTKSNIKEVSSVLSDCVKMQIKNVDNTTYFIYDKKFHLTFFDFCQNNRFKKLYKQYHTLWDILVKYYYSYNDSKRENAIYQHQKILDSYSMGDIILAQKYLDDHFQSAAQSFKKMIVPD